MSNEEIEWTELDKRRNLLLAQSDWTQLPDTNLTIECVMAWRGWRSSIRNINSSNYGDRFNAVLDLEKFSKSQPVLDFSGKKYSFFEQTDNAVYNRLDLSDIVRDIVVDLLPTIQSIDTSAIEAPVEPPRELTLKDMPDILSAKKFAQQELATAYAIRIKNASAPPEMGQFYAERLNQAIDCLSDIGESYPLLEVLLDDTSQDVKKFAKIVLKRHSVMIHEFVEIETKYLQSLKVIEESDKIASLEEALETF